MKKIIKSFKSQPLPLKLIVLGILLWVFPFIESGLVQAQGWDDLSIIAKAFLLLGSIPVFYLFIMYGIAPAIYWIGVLFGINKKK